MTDKAIAKFEESLDDILHQFAKRVENLPRGKTYGWDSERAAIRVAAEELVAARVREALQQVMNNAMAIEYTNSIDAARIRLSLEVAIAALEAPKEIK